MVAFALAQAGCHKASRSITVVLHYWFSSNHPPAITAALHQNYRSGFHVQITPAGGGEPLKADPDEMGRCTFTQVPAGSAIAVSLFDQPVSINVPHLSPTGGPTAALSGPLDAMNWTGNEVRIDVYTDYKNDSSMDKMDPMLFYGWAFPCFSFKAPVGNQKMVPVDQLALRISPAGPGATFDGFKFPLSASLPMQQWSLLVPATIYNVDLVEGGRVLQSWKCACPPGSTGIELDLTQSAIDQM